jgi:hypothetical protein
MAMELLPFYYQSVTDFPPDDQDDNFASFDIIQRTQVPHPQFKLDQRIDP